MRSRISVLLIVLLFALAFPARAEDLPVIELVPGQSAEGVETYLRFEPIASGDPVTAHNPANSQRLRHSSIQFGKAGEHVLIRMRLRNIGDKPASWFVSTGRGSVDLLEIYKVSRGDLQQVFDNADKDMLGRSLADYQAIAFELRLAEGEEAEYVMKFHDTISLWMPISIQPYGDFFRERRENIAMVSAVVFGSIVLALLTVVVFFVTGRPAFVWLGAAEFVFALNTLYAEGYTTIFLLYRWPEIATFFGEVSRSAFCVLMIQFARVLLDSPHSYPRIDLVLRTYLVAGCLLIGIALIQMAWPMLPVMPIRSAGWIFLLLTALTLPFLAVLSARENPVNWPLMIGWLAMGLYMGYMTVAVSGYVPSWPVKWHWLGPIGLFECLMASLTLALHLRSLEVARIEAERHARSALLSKLALSEEAARLAEDRARALSEVRSRDRLLVGSAHDTRHVLHALNTAAYYGARHGTGSEASNQLVELIESSARHLEDIISSSISVGDSEGKFAALSVVSVANLLRTLEAIYAPIAQSNGVALRITCDADSTALLDEALFARLISNLLNNALKFTDSGSVELECSSDDGLLRLTVRDTGSGIPPAIARWLEEQSGTDALPPADLGVNTGWRAIRSIIALLKGGYSVDSTADGTTIEIVLPNPVDCQLTPCTTAELSALLPSLAFVEYTDLPQASTGAIGRTVVVAEKADALIRERSAAVACLLLAGPLCREMAEHRYVVDLASRPLLRAASTS